jgi:hypothetical protein
VSGASGGGPDVNAGGATTVVKHGYSGFGVGPAGTTGGYVAAAPTAAGFAADYAAAGAATGQW